MSLHVVAAVQQQFADDPWSIYGQQCYHEQVADTVGICPILEVEGSYHDQDGGDPWSTKVESCAHLQTTSAAICPVVSARDCYHYQRNVPPWGEHENWFCDSYHEQVAGDPVLTDLVIMIHPEDVAQTQEADGPSVVHTYFLEPHFAHQKQFADEPDVYQPIDVESCYQAQYAGEPGVYGLYTVDPQGCVQKQYADRAFAGVNLDAEDSYQEQYAPTPPLFGVGIIPQDCSHSQVAEEPVLTDIKVNYLQGVQKGSHIQTATTVNKITILIWPDDTDDLLEITDELVTSGAVGTAHWTVISDSLLLYDEAPPIALEVQYATLIDPLSLTDEVDYVYNGATVLTVRDCYHIQVTTVMDLITVTGPVVVVSNLDLPLFEMSIRIDDIRGNLDLPLFELDSQVDIGIEVTGNLDLPLFEIGAKAAVGVGIIGNLDLPLFQFDAIANAAVDVVGNLDLPLYSIDATVTENPVITADLYLPLFSLDAIVAVEEPESDEILLINVDGGDDWQSYP